MDEMIGAISVEAMAIALYEGETRRQFIVWDEGTFREFYFSQARAAIKFMYQVLGDNFLENCDGK